MTKTGQFFSEFIASTILMFCIYSLQDNGNIGAGNLTPLALFFVIFGIGACFGWETGYAINLARDFGPRLVSYFLGYGHEVWAAGNYYFWVPMVAPFFGCTFGGWLYDVFIFTGKSAEIYLPQVDSDKIARGESDKHSMDGFQTDSQAKPGVEQVNLTDIRVPSLNHRPELLAKDHLGL